MELKLCGSNYEHNLRPFVCKSEVDINLQLKGKEAALCGKNKGYYCVTSITRFMEF